MSLHVHQPGLQSLVVDGGRPSSRSLGVPVGGAADRMAWRLGNALVGNPPDAAALEICLAGPTLQAECDLGLAAVGAPFDVSINEKPIACNHAFNVRRGDRIRIDGARAMARAYLCVRGGLLEPQVLDSRSAFEPIRRGQTLTCSPGLVNDLGFRYPDDRSTTLRALPGPQSDWFDLEQFFGQKFQLTPASNRMGLRLRGEPLQKPARELVSEPVAPGAVQVVNDGQCIVLGVDGQTIGGYPKIAHVIDADLDRLGQLRPGGDITFELVGLDEAEAAGRERDRWLHSFETRLRLG